MAHIIIVETIFRDYPRGGYSPLECKVNVVRFRSAGLSITAVAAGTSTRRRRSSANLAVFRYIYKPHVTMARIPNLPSPIIHDPGHVSIIK